jgi:hypothetical protein
MASASSKAIPFIVLAIAFGLTLFQAATGINVNLESLVPLLTLMGVGGIPLSIAKNALAGRAAFDVATLKQALIDAGFVPK